MCFLSYPFQVREKEAAEGTSVYSYYDVMTCLVDSPQHSVGMLFMNQMFKKNKQTTIAVVRDMLL